MSSALFMYNAVLLQRISSQLRPIPRQEVRQAFLGGADMALNGPNCLRAREATLAACSTPETRAFAHDVMEAIEKPLDRFVNSKKAAREYPNVDRVRQVQRALLAGSIAVAALPLPEVDHSLFDRFAAMRNDIVAKLKNQGLQEEQAEDIYQGAFHKAKFKINCGHQPLNPSGWFGRLCRNHACDELHKENRRRRIEQQVESMDVYPAPHAPSDPPPIDEDRRMERQSFLTILGEVVVPEIQQRNPPTAKTWSAVRCDGVSENDQAAIEDTTRDTIASRVRRGDRIAQRILEDNSFAPWL
jgi:DNA-directed RNA polymerase specialized sigma24 family protein